MSQKFEKPVKWEHFDRFLPITLFTRIESILNYLYRVPLNFSLPEHIHLTYFKIIRTPPLKFGFGCQTPQFNVSTLVARASSEL